MPKAARVLAALRRDGWVQVRQRGSHRRLVKNGVAQTWAHHDAVDLGAVDMTRIARDFGYTLDELRNL